MRSPSPATSAILRSRRGVVPAWWADAKLGIFVHWVPASVPGFAPTASGIVDLMASQRPDPLAELPYSEWYENSLRFPGSSVARFHREHYGNRPYADFAEDFAAGTDRWDAREWARRFAATGARYVILVTKHHDGWCLWPSEVANPHRPGWHSARDLVGELADAVRAEGMRFGIYYSGGYDWTFDTTPIGALSDVLRATPRGDYIAYAEAQVRELIERYRPSVLWNDIAWPSPWPDLAELLADYFRVVPDGVVNDRWMTGPDLRRVLGLPGASRAVDAIARRSVRKRGIVPPRPRFFQHRTPEFSTFPEIDRRPWEATRGMDQGFGYNRASTEADHLGQAELIGSLVDTVSKGGNLLLNVGPRGEDAQIPEAQLRRLDWLAEWMAANASALQGTTPWVRASATSPEGRELHFTARGSRVWAIPTPARDGSPGPGDHVTLPLLAGPTTRVRSASGVALAFEPVDGAIRVTLAPTADDATSPGAAMFAPIAVDDAEAAPERP